MSNEIRDRLLAMSPSQLGKFIRERLAIDEHMSLSFRGGPKEIPHLRFDMSGYETQRGACTVHNQMVLNRFADLGIYDYTEYLFLDFYKGSGRLYLKYFTSEEEKTYEFIGEGTVEIIGKILSLTVLSGKGTRRRI